jgi:hypothetical protein
LKVNGITKTNHIDQAEALNNQFHSAFTTPKPLKLSNICELNKLKSQEHKFQMHDIIITPEGTSKLLKKSKSNQSNRSRQDFIPLSK